MLTDNPPTWRRNNSWRKTSFRSVCHRYQRHWHSEWPVHSKTIVEHLGSWLCLVDDGDWQPVCPDYRHCQQCAADMASKITKQILVLPGNQHNCNLPYTQHKTAPKQGLDVCLGLVICGPLQPDQYVSSPNRLQLDCEGTQPPWGTKIRHTLRFVLWAIRIAANPIIFRQYHRSEHLQIEVVYDVFWSLEIQDDAVQRPREDGCGYASVWLNQYLRQDCKEGTSEAWRSP